ncbi:glycosyltransferase [Halomonas sp. AOP22-C1-8]|uniref:glycosyltransferase n=1 Tax=Halomonas sp. AOP22-C1-8 TaxID=3457717 RepID=UPI004033C3FF
MSHIIVNGSMRVACIIPTYNGCDVLRRLLDSLERQNARFDLFMVDSSSVDGTQELAGSRVENLTIIPSSEFNHGGTRQMMIDKYPGYDIYVFITQDAYLEDSEAVERLVQPFTDESVGAVCGRQLPHLDANLLAQHARLFNYPDVSRIKSLDDASQLGIKTPFMSNSFSAYRASALREVGGFPDHVILSEDMYVAARMLLSNWKVAYASDAKCRHSHDYSLVQEFHRYFDQGVFHAREPWIRQSFGGAGGEGLRYVKSEIEFLGLSKWYIWPSIIVRNFLKLSGYKLGQQEKKLSSSLKKKLSMHKHYWDSPHAEKY